MSFRLTDKQYQLVKDYCGRTDISMSLYIKGLIEDDFKGRTKSTTSPTKQIKKERTFKETTPDPRILSNPFNVLRTSENVSETQAQNVTNK